MFAKETTEKIEGVKIEGLSTSLGYKISGVALISAVYTPCWG